MTEWPARTALSSISDEIATHLCENPKDADGHCFHAKILNDLGSVGEADASYARALVLAPDHLGALVGSAILAQRAGRRNDARALLERAVVAHGDSAVAHVNLAHMLSVEDTSRAKRHYEQALAIEPEMREAHEGVCALLASLGDRDGAALHRERAFHGAATRVLPYRGTQWPIPALLLVSTNGGNVYTEQLLDDSVYQVTKLYVEAFDPSTPLPLHRVVVNGVGDADRSHDALERAIALTQRISAPVVNDPAAVLQGGRVNDAARLADIADVRTPWVVPFDRDDPPAYPFLLRVVGHHMGRYFERIDDAESLLKADAAFPRGDRVAIEWVDTAAAGTYRKYRVMIVDGELYPLHLAIGSHWKTHYFSADMVASKAHRDEERAFLNDMRGVLGPAALAALHEIARRLGLDYAGIDFSLDRRGTVVLFEANATMTVIEPDVDPRFGYRRIATERILGAMRRMVRVRLGE